MQKLKEQRVAPIKKIIIETIKDTKESTPGIFGEICWYSKDNIWLFSQDFGNCKLWVGGIFGLVKSTHNYNVIDKEMIQLLTKLLYEYTNNGQLEISIQ